MARPRAIEVLAWRNCGQLMPLYHGHSPSDKLCAVHSLRDAQTRLRELN